MLYRTKLICGSICFNENKLISVRLFTGYNRIPSLANQYKLANCKGLIEYWFTNDSLFNSNVSSLKLIQFFK